MGLVLAAGMPGNAAHWIELFVLGMAPHAFNSGPNFGPLF
jgi:hypothetical protein